MKSDKRETDVEILPVSPRDSQSLRGLVDVVQPDILIEFGSWEGRSALTFVERALEKNLRTRVICVDTWLGSPEHWRNSAPDSEWSFDRLNVVDGEPRVLDTFRSAMRDHGVGDRVSIVRAPTSLAAIYLSRLGIFGDLVYVDADHSYRAVVEDLRLAERILADDGVIAGDDWAWGSVRLAVVRYAGRRRSILRSSDSVTYVLLGVQQTDRRKDFLADGWVEVRKFSIFAKELPRLTRKYVLKRVMRALDSLYIALGLARLARLIRR